MKAMILAAGLGTRMGELTRVHPKPLLQAGGRSLIEWQIEKLVSAGITDIVINLFHLGEQIEQTLGDGSRLGASINYSRESERLETAGGIIKALPLLADDSFIVVNADVWTDFDFGRLQSPGEGTAHPQALAHLVLVPNPPRHPEGDFYLDAVGHASRVTPTTGNQQRHTFSGISVLHRQLFAGLEVEPRPLLPLLLAAMAEQRVSAELYEGDWQDIGTPESLLALDRTLGQTPAGL